MTAGLWGEDPGPHSGPKKMTAGLWGEDPGPHSGPKKDDGGPWGKGPPCSFARTKAAPFLGDEVSA